jgi:hypothetical protein
MAAMPDVPATGWTFRTDNGIPLQRTATGLMTIHLAPIPAR